MPKPLWACALCHLTPPDVARSKRKRDLCDLCVDSLEARGLAWCSWCNRRKTQNEMKSTGRHCKACEASYQRRRRAGNRDAYNATERTRRQADPERHRVAQRRYYQRNADMIRAKSQAWYIANRERAIARRKAWYAANRERELARARETKYAMHWRQRRKLRLLQSWKRAA